MDSSHNKSENPTARPAKPSVFAPILAILWAFLGVRRRGDFEQDTQQLKPKQVIAVGLIGGFLFVLALMLLVNWVV